ncbi:hypothetical protein NLJ89_g10209 [Agrocybe chaxingu]|uniref:F-box domain-containing protein n=1 Tax=Agrocybe chaxingu TaxID=84603 RepID=A0A9W8MSU9_9AGAR|nr:hypothetical protein NLJ89_g10209 [Agrocybe chaxingu]
MNGRCVSPFPPPWTTPLSPSAMQTPTKSGHSTIFHFLLGPTDEILQYPVSVWKRGNYITACIRRGLREEARKAMQHSFPVPRPQDISHLPNELLFEIFEKLHPLDLYHLCQTSKDLRKLLLNGEAFSHVWKAAYENYPTLPSCPQDVSLPKWTSLLFGPDSCDMCGAEYAMTDIAFRARYCDNCMDEYYFTRSDLRRVIQTGPNYYGAALSLARSSTRSSGVNYTKHESKRFLRSDVERICQQMQKRAANMELGALAASIDSSREFGEFLEHKTHTRECNKWCRTQYTLCERVHETTTEALARRFVSHKFAKRFDPQDLFSPSVTTSLYELFLYSGVRKLRGPTFRSSLTSISKIFSDARVLRLESERTQREHARCKRIHDEFDGYMATMPARNGRVCVQRDGGPRPREKVPDVNEVVCELKRFIVTCFEDHQRDLQAANTLF